MTKTEELVVREVSERMRVDEPVSKYQAIYDDLFGGKTLITNSWSGQKVSATLGGRCKRHGYQLRTHVTKDGVVFWAENLNDHD